MNATGGLEAAVSLAHATVRDAQTLGHDLIAHEGAQASALGYVPRKRIQKESDVFAKGSTLRSRLLYECVCTDSETHNFCKRFVRESVAAEKKNIEGLLLEAGKPGGFIIIYNVLKGAELAAKMYGRLAEVLPTIDGMPPQYVDAMQIKASEFKAMVADLQKTFGSFVGTNELHFNCEIAEDWHVWPSIRVPLSDIIASLPENSKACPRLKEISYSMHEDMPKEQETRLRNVIDSLQKYHEKYMKKKD